MRDKQFVNHVEISADWVQRRDQDKFFKKVRSVAGDMVPELARRFNQVKKKCGLQDANLELTHLNELSDRLRKSVSCQTLRKLDLWRKDLDMAATDDDINTFCDAKARQCSILIRDSSQDRLYESLLTIIDSYGITLGNGEREKILELDKPILERLQTEKWWRKKVKPLAFRTCEQIMRELGHTQRGRGCYVSDYTFRRFLGRERRNGNLLQALEATNELGEVYTLSQLSELGMSNHELRRGELMVRMRGFEEWAEQDQHDWTPMFYTITCPSKYHLYSNDEKNTKYNLATPKDAQSYLCTVWARIRAEASRQAIKFFGFRVAEPHHDGCPHWHMLLFVRADQSKSFTGIIRSRALAEDGNEPGAQKHRFEAVAIVPEKGTAAGYIAKYVSKNIDGVGVALDEEAQELTVNTAARVRAWAACWGIRQFQQIGGPPVTVYRELRRLARHPERIPPDCYVPKNERDEKFIEAAPRQLELAIDAADAGNWCEFTNQMGGAVCPRKDRPIQLEIHDRVDLNQYGEVVKHIYGVFTKWFVFPLRTRFHHWRVTLKRVATTGARMIRERTDAHLYPVDFFGGATAPPLDLCQ